MRTLLVLPSSQASERGGISYALNTSKNYTRNTWLAKPREARAGWTVDFYLGCAACDIPICGSSAPLFPPEGAVFAEPSDVVFALWFADVSFFFVARAESDVAFHVKFSGVSLFNLPRRICLVSCVSSCGSFASRFGRVSPIVNIFHCSMNKHVEPSMNKHESGPLWGSGFLL